LDSRIEGTQEQEANAPIDSAGRASHVECAVPTPSGKESLLDVVALEVRMQSAIGISDPEDGIKSANVPWDAGIIP